MFLYYNSSIRARTNLSTVKGGILITGRSSYCLKSLIRFVIVLTLLLLGQTITFASQTVINNIKIRNFESKTRIVLDFSSSLENYTIEEINRNLTSITIANADLISNINPAISFSNNHKLIFDKNDNCLKININLPESRLKTFTLDNPDRLIIDLLGVKAESSSPKQSNTNGFLHPAVKHTQYRFRGPVFINVLDIDLNHQDVELTPITPNQHSLFSKKNVNQIVNNANGLAGINGSFFKPPNGLPLGTVIIDEEFITGPIYNRVALVIDKNNKAYLDKVKLNSQIILKSGETLNVNNINQPRLSLDGYMLYTDKWNTFVPKTLKNELRIAIIKNKVSQVTTGSIKVPLNGYVITGPHKDGFKKLKIGDDINISINYDSKISDIKHAIGGGPYLLKDGQVYIDITSQKFSLNASAREPRTAVGITANNHLLLVTVDGRQNGSIGMSFYQLAAFLKSIGAVNAMNFDGGSSTQMSIKGRTVNSPTVRGGAQVSTSIIVKIVEKFTIANKYP
ncbi:MAG: phosphodiester glycosidase family protein [Cyanobacteriota bacterium]